MKRTFSLLLATMLLLTSIGFAPAVLADDANAEQADVEFAGMGKLSAQGDGIAVLSGKGKVDLSGNGILWIKDLAGNAQIDVNGFGSKKVFPDGWIQYAGAHGTAHIRGSNIRIVIAGVNIDFQARGRGTALLWGHGTCTFNGKLGQWDNNNFGKFLKF